MPTPGRSDDDEIDIVTTEHGFKGMGPIGVEVRLLLSGFSNDLGCMLCLFLHDVAEGYHLGICRYKVLQQRCTAPTGADQCDTWIPLFKWNADHSVMACRLFRR